MTPPPSTLAVLAADAPPSLPAPKVQIDAPAPLPADRVTRHFRRRPPSPAMMVVPLRANHLQIDAASATAPLPAHCVMREKMKRNGERKRGKGEAAANYAPIVDMPPVGVLGRQRPLPLPLLRTPPPSPNPPAPTGLPHAARATAQPARVPASAMGIPRPPLPPRGPRCPALSNDDGGAPPRRDGAPARPLRRERR